MCLCDVEVSEDIDVESMMSVQAASPLQMHSTHHLPNHVGNEDKLTTDRGRSFITRQ